MERCDQCQRTKNRNASRKIQAKHSTRKTVAIYISGLDYKVTGI